MSEEELKKGCGKEAGFITFTDDFGNKDEDVMLCGDTTKKINGEIELFLCDTCQAKLEGFQKGKLEERERIIEVVKGFLGRNDYQRFIKALDKKISKISRKRRIGLE